MTKPSELRVVAMRLAPTHTVTEIARIVGVSRQTIYRWRRSGRCDAHQLRRRGRRSVLTTTLLRVLRQWIKEAPGQTLGNLQRRFQSEHSVRVSCVTIGRWLK
ncbi:MAG: helix-turn-helix domain-containing protein [Aestuariibacter sp.]|nr:helix-turn-helix domain-containing protein [Aestuariibacter sp.]